MHSTRKRPRGEKREINGWRRELQAQAQRGGGQGGNYEPWVGPERWKSKCCHSERHVARWVCDVSFAHLVRTHVAVWRARDGHVRAAGGRSLKPRAEGLQELVGNAIHLSADALDARSPWHHSFTSTQVWKDANLLHIIKPCTFCTINDRKPPHPLQRGVRWVYYFSFACILAVLQPIFEASLFLDCVPLYSHHSTHLCSSRQMQQQPFDLLWPLKSTSDCSIWPVDESNMAPAHFWPCHHSSDRIYIQVYLYYVHVIAITVK